MTEATMTDVYNELVTISGQITQTNAILLVMTGVIIGMAIFVLLGVWFK